MRGHGHGPWAFSVEYLLGQCYRGDREGQRLDQSLFSDSQATESEGKGDEETLVNREKSLRVHDQKKASSNLR